MGAADAGGATDARAPVTPPASADWKALGTMVQLIVTDPVRLADGRRLLEADLAAGAAACSRFRSDSELVALDSVPGPVEVSPLLAQALAVALRAARLTDGDVDPTVGAAMAAIGYDRDFPLVPASGPAVTLTVRSVPGWRQVQFDEQSRILALPPGGRLDLGATAQAWGADRAAAPLEGGRCPGGRRIRRSDRQPSWRSATAGWPRRAPRHGAGGAAATCCITSWTRAPACRRQLAGARSRLRRRAAPMRTRPAPRRSYAAAAPKPGSPVWACPPAWSTRPGTCTP